MRIYDKRSGYANWFISLSDVVASAVVWALLAALVFGIVYSVV